MPMPSERTALLVHVFRMADTWQCEVSIDERLAGGGELGVEGDASEIEALESARRIFAHFEEVMVLRIPDR
jgi:hypothetical protein